MGDEDFEEQLGLIVGGGEMRDGADEGR